MKINVFAIVGVIILVAVIWFLFRPSEPTVTGYCTLPIEKEKVIFAYYDGCPACGAMKPIMEKRNDVYWLDVHDGKCQELIKQLNLNFQFVPTSICAKNTSVLITGAMSESAISEWIEKNC